MVALRQVVPPVEVAAALSGDFIHATSLVRNFVKDHYADMAAGPSSARSAAAEHRSVDFDTVDKVLTHVFSLSRGWVVAVCVAAVLSTFHVQCCKDAAVEFRLTAITAGLVALIWLPALLRLLALAGGAVKTPGGEATTPGIVEFVKSFHLDTPAERDALASVGAVLDAAASTSDLRRDDQVEDTRRRIEERLAALVPNVSDARARLEELANRYELLRESLPSGSERTMLMNRLVVEARSLAEAARVPPISLSDESNFRDGARIVTLAAVQADPNPRYLDIALDALSTPKSAFEQYQALRAVEFMLPALEKDDRKRVRSVIEAQRSGGPGHWISRDDPSRWLLSERLLEQL